MFKRVCHAALAQPAKRFLLVVDEINRANVAKVLGELITLAELTGQIHGSGTKALIEAVQQGIGLTRHAAA